MEDFNISVIIPVYNVENFLEKAVTSSLKSSYVKEVLLIEDGSKDNSLEVCQKLRDKYSKVKLLQHSDKGNHGAGPSRNIGIEHSRFPYIAFLDADDYYLDDRFNETKKAFIKYPDADGIYECLGITFYNERSREKWKSMGRKNFTSLVRPIKPEKLFTTLIKGKHGFFSIVALTVKKSSLKDIRFDDIKISQDTLFILKLASLKKLYPGNITSPVAIRGVHPNNRHSKSNRDLLLHRIRMYNRLNKWLLTLSISGHKRRLVISKMFNEELNFINRYENSNSKRLFNLMMKYRSHYYIFYTKYIVKYMLSIVGIMRFLDKKILI